MTVGDKIREVREAKGITMQELADEIGTTKQAIYKYESGGVTNIPVERIAKIAKALNVSPSYLMGWSSEMQMSEHEKKVILSYRVHVKEQPIVDMILGIFKKKKVLKIARSNGNSNPELVDAPDNIDSVQETDDDL